MELASAAPKKDVLRPTLWRVAVGVLVPAVMLGLWGGVAPLWSEAPALVVVCVGVIVLFALAFVPWSPPAWVDRMHGRLLVLGAILGACAAVLFVPFSLVAIVSLFAGGGPFDPGTWVPRIAFVFIGPLLVATTRAYWRTADALARRGFRGGEARALPTAELERTFE